MDPDAYLTGLNEPRGALTPDDFEAGRIAIEKAYETNMADRAERVRRAAAFLESVPLAARDSMAVAVKAGIIAEGYVIHPADAREIERAVAEAIANVAG